MTVGGGLLVVDSDAKFGGGGCKVESLGRITSCNDLSKAMRLA